jgi:hypothetical protein
MKPRLQIVTGLETSDSEMRIIEEAFSDSFEVEVRRDFTRASGGELPLALHIALTVLAPAVVPVFKYCIDNLHRGLPSDKTSEVKLDVREEKKQIIIGQQINIVINYNSQPTPTEERYETAEDALRSVGNKPEKPETEED